VRSLVLAACAGFAVALAGCDREPVAPDEALSEIPAPTFAVTDNYWMWLPGWTAEFCGDELEADLQVHVLGSYTETPSGNLHWKFKYDIHGTAVGLTTGYEYVWNDIWVVEHVNVAPGGFPYTFQSVDNWVIVGRGQAPNFKAKVTVHTTVNALDDITVDFVKYDEVCK